MKKYFFVFALLGMTFAGFAQTGPEITFDNETLDYGTIPHSSDGAREFTFNNTGDEPLIISNCRGSCGCTVPKCPEEAILPGEGGVIKVKYDTKRMGPFTKTITVSSNATGGSKIIKITGKVVKAEGAEESSSEDGAAPDPNNNGLNLVPQNQ